MCDGMVERKMRISQGLLDVITAPDYESGPVTLKFSDDGEYLEFVVYAWPAP